MPPNVMAILGLPIWNGVSIFDFSWIIIVSSRQDEKDGNTLVLDKREASRGYYLRIIS